MAKGKRDFQSEPDTFNPLLELVKGYAGEREPGFGSQEGADWSSIDAGLLASVIYTVCKQKGAVLFGHDRSGFMYCVTVFCGGQKVTKYFHPTNELEALMSFLVTLAEIA